MVLKGKKLAGEVVRSIREVVTLVGTSHVTRTQARVSDMYTYPCVKLVNFLDRKYSDIDLNSDMGARRHYGNK